MFYDGVNLAEGSEIKNLTVATGSVFPTESSTGELFFSTDKNQLFVYDSADWKPISIRSGNTQPANGKIGEIFFKSDDNQILVYTASGWTSTGSSGGTGAANSLTGTTLAPNVTQSSLSTVGVVQNLKAAGSISVDNSSTLTSSSLTLGTKIFNTAFNNSFITVGASSSFTVTGDFTVELMWYPTSGSRQALFSGSTDYWMGIDFNSTNNSKLGMWVSSNGTSWNVVNSDGGGNGIGQTVVTLNTWHHIAMTRKGNSYNLFLDGKLEKTVISTNLPISRPAENKRIGGWANNLYLNSGLICNFRFVNGDAVYINNDPNDPNKDFYFEKVELLLNGDSFKDRGPLGKKVTNTSGVTLDNAIVKTGTSSFNFTGTNHLEIQNSFVGTGDFTLEMWCYLNHGDWGGYDIFIGSDNAFPYLRFSDSGYGNTLQASIDDAGRIDVSSRTALLEKWTHIAFTRQNGMTRLFLDGVLQGSRTDNTSIQAGKIYIGRSPNGHNFIGNLSDIRFTMGVARYVENFTARLTPFPVSENIDQHVSKNVLLIDGNTTIVDKTVNAKSIANSNVVVSSDQSKFGGSSLYFNGGSRLNIANHSDFDFGLENFTIEFWMRPDSISGGTKVLIDRGNYSNFTPWIIAQDNGTLSFSCSSTDGNSWTVLIGSTSVLTAAQWHHVAAVRNGNTFTLYVDGTNVGSGYFSGSLNVKNIPVVIGRTHNDFYGYNGYLDDIRITKGAARYISNFTVPAKQHEVNEILNTELFLTGDNLIDSSLKSRSVIVNGSGQVSTTEKKKGSGSLKCGNGISYQVDNFPALTGDFSVEFWVKFSNISAYDTLFNLGGGYSGGILLRGNTTSIDLFIPGGSGHNFAFTRTANQWYHFAFYRSAGKYYLSIDGILCSNIVTSGSTVPEGQFRLGQSIHNAGEYTNGFIDDLKIVVGDIKYGKAFNTPTAILPVTTNTKLLTCVSNSLKDWSSSSLAITPTGSVIFSENTELLTSGSAVLSVTADGFLVEDKISFSSVDITKLKLSGSPGTAGQVLTSTGVSAVPTWTNPVTLPVPLTSGNYGTAGQVLTSAGVSAVPTWESQPAPFSANQNNTYTKAQRGAIVELTSSTSITPDFSLSNNYSLLASTNFTLNLPTNLVAGQSGLIIIKQDATGSRVITFGTGWVAEGGSKPTLSTAANTVDYLTYFVESETRVFVNAVLNVS